MKRSVRGLLLTAASLGWAAPAAAQDAEGLVGTWAGTITEDDTYYEAWVEIDLDKDNRPLAHLANYPDWQKQVDEKKLRVKPDTWEAGKFVHPHDACFDHDGNIIVTEWVEPGRVTKLTRLT